MSVNIEYNNKEVSNIVMENILKMLERRNIIKSWNIEYKKIESELLNKNIFQIELIDKSIYSIYILNSKLVSIINSSPLDNYLLSNINIHKIIIAKDITKKAIKQIINEYKNAEFFFESEMMEDIPSKVFIPLHKIMNNEEKKELLEKFLEIDIAKIFISDMMSRYYGAKVGDIFRITRPSFIAGKNIFYRRVVNSSYDILF